jgi:hypothetical protein
MMQEGRATQEANTEIALNKEKMRQKKWKEVKSGCERSVAWISP